MNVRADIAELLRQGVPHIQIARRLHIDPATVRRTREALGLPAPVRGHVPAHATVEDAFHAHTQPRDDGHVVWTGYRESGLPMLFHGAQRIPAPRVAFRLHHGREAVGRITRTCGVGGCVAGPCLADRPMREANRRADLAFAVIFPGAS